MKRLIIIGASGFGREAAQWAKDINKINKRWDEISLIDDNLDALAGYECDYKVIDTISGYTPRDCDEFVMAIANPDIKEKLVGMLEGKGAKFISLIHPDARLGDHNKIGKGVVIYPDTRITVNTNIGDFVTILFSTNIGHDASIGDFATVCGNCGINGHVEIGRKAFVGAHVTTAPSTRIGEKAFVGTGSVVINNVAEGARVFGNPARKIM